MPVDVLSEGKDLFAEDQDLLANLPAPKRSISDIMRGKGLEKQDLSSALQAAGEVAKAGGRGVAKFAITGGGLGEIGLPFLSGEEYKQYVEPYVGTTPPDYKPIETIADIGSMFVPLGKVATELGKIPRYLKETPKTAEDVLTGARSLGEQLTTSARTKAEEAGGQAEKDRLTREIAIKKEMARPEKYRQKLLKYMKLLALKLNLLRLTRLK